MGAKKFMTIISLLIANLAIIAHNVTPHHHHDGIVCMASMCANDCCNTGEDDSHHHGAASHSCHGSPGECELKQTMTREAQNGSIQLNIPLTLLMVHHCCGLSSCGLEKPDFSTFFRQKPYLESYLTTYVSLTLGLRAPPHVSFLG